MQPPKMPGVSAGVNPNQGDGWAVTAYRNAEKGQTVMLITVNDNYMATMPDVDDMEICHDCGQTLPDYSPINDVIRGLAAMFRG